MNVVLKKKPAPQTVEAAATVVSSTPVNKEPQEALPGVPANVAPAPEPTTALAPRPSAGLAVSEDSGLAGEYTADDIRLPRLQIVQGSGELSSKFNVGSLLYADEVLCPPNDPAKPSRVLRFIPVFLRKQFRENLTKEQKDAGDMPRIVNTLDEVRAYGGTTQFIGDEKPSWSPSAQVFLMLEQPEGVDHTGFLMEIEGKCYGPAVYYASSTAYRTLALPIINAGLADQRSAKPGVNVLPKRVWKLTIAKRPAGDFTIFVPEAKATIELTSETLRAECLGLMGGKPAPEIAG